MKNKRIPYVTHELFDLAPHSIYSGRKLDQIAFPLGGIGTGTVSIGGWGQLRDFELFNRPAKGLQFANTFFSLHVQSGQSDQSITRVLQGPVGGGSFAGDGQGVNSPSYAGLPHFKKCKFTGYFPIARIDFQDDRGAVEVAMEAFNPFIPLNDKDSGLPTAIFLFHLKNRTSELAKVNLFANLENMVGYPETGQGSISFRQGEHVAGLDMTTKKHKSSSPRYGTLSLTTPWKSIGVRTSILPGDSSENPTHYFWDQISQTGEIEENRETIDSSEYQNDVASLWLKATLEPNELVVLPIFITWHNPNYEWNTGAVWQNYYATLFDSAFDVAEYVGENFDRLDAETRLFRDTLHESTLPAPVLSAVSSQISTLKTPTCLRLSDGTFYGFEGCDADSGRGEGTPTSVWNYAQVLPYLFPKLERSIRESDYAHNITGKGHMTYRTPLPLGTMGSGQLHAAADGQLGGIMKLYRDWLICGDDEWLKSLWEHAKRALEFSWQKWDRSKSGVIDDAQHNTYEVQFHGANSMVGTFYLGALRAGEEISRYLGDTKRAEIYRELFEKGRSKLDKNLFNGSFYRQQVFEHGENITDSENFPKHQYGDGCLSDQLVGQWYARMLGLGDLLDPKHVKRTLSSIFKHNWKSDLSEHVNQGRVYALNDESGLVVCSWPMGGRPPVPLPACDEIWSGVEYQVASHMAYEGLTEESLAIVKGVRERYDGTHRNPWDEFESGHHNARSMSSYALLLSLSGFHYNATEQMIAFNPRVHKRNFSCFFSVDSGWGIYRQRITAKGIKAELEMRYGTLNLRSIRFGGGDARADLGGGTIAVSNEGNSVIFSESIEIVTGKTLKLTL